MKCNTAIVLAAGSGKRMQSAVAKQYLILKDKPVIWYALQAFQQSKVIHRVILVVGPEEVENCKENIVDKFGFSKVSAVIEGGAERYLSVWEALRWLEEKQKPGAEEYIFIHDGARPFVNEKIIVQTYEAAREYGACVAAMPVKDTIKIADEEGFAIQTPNRKTVWAVQTPQVFERGIITEAYRNLIKELEELPDKGVEITDDAMVLEAMSGKRVKLVKASYENMKITTPEDMRIAESFISCI